MRLVYCEREDLPIGMGESVPNLIESRWCWGVVIFWEHPFDKLRTPPEEAEERGRIEGGGERETLGYPVPFDTLRKKLRATQDANLETCP